MQSFCFFNFTMFNDSNMIFVTGGTGLLGSHLLVELTRQEEKNIRAIYRNENKRNQVKALFQFYFGEEWEQFYSKIQWRKGDILDVFFLEEVIEPDCEVYHCAALVSFDRRDYTKLIKINREGTANIVNVCLSKRVKKLCHVSSTAAIGGENGEKVTEERKWKITPTTTGYAISKHMAEKEVWRGIEEGLNAVIVNPCVILGAGNWNDSSLTIFSTVQKGTRFYPPGGNATVDARDVASIMYQLMKTDISAERFLLIGNNQKFKTLIDTIAEELNKPKPTIQVQKWMVFMIKPVLDFICFVLRKRNPMTRETINSLFTTISYCNDKIKNTLNYSFIPLKESVKNAVKGKI